MQLTSFLLLLCVVQSNATNEYSSFNGNVAVFIKFEIRNWSVTEWIVDDMDIALNTVISDAVGYLEHVEQMNDDMKQVQVQILDDAETLLRIGVTIYGFNNRNQALRALAAIMLDVANQKFLLRLAYDPVEVPTSISVTHTHIFSLVPREDIKIAGIQDSLKSADDNEDSHTEHGDDDSFKTLIVFVLIGIFLSSLLFMIGCRIQNAVDEDEAKLKDLSKPLLVL